MIIYWTPVTAYLVTGTPQGPSFLSGGATELNVDVHELIVSEVVTG